MLNRDSRLFRSCSTLMIAMFAVATLPLNALGQDAVKIPAGTAVQVKFPQELGTKDLVPGQEINLIAATAVLVNDQEVIAEGAPIIAEIVSVQKPGAIGKPGEIAVSFKFVQAVDDSRVALTGQEMRDGESKQTTALVITILCCILGLFMKGGDVTIPAGSVVTALTVTDATVTI